MRVLGGVLFVTALLAAHRESVRQAFLSMWKSEAGNKLLAKVPLKDVVVASSADYEILTKLGPARFYPRD